MRSVLVPAIAASVLFHAGLLAMMSDIRPSIASTRTSVALSLREPPPPPPKVEPAPKPPTPIAVDPPPKRVRIAVKEKPPALEEKAPEPEDQKSRPSEVESAEPARSPTPGPKEAENGTGPAAGNGPMLGAGVNVTEGPPSRTEAKNTAANGTGSGAAKAKSDLQGYHRNIYNAVRAAQRYPAQARRLGLEGRVVLAIRIDRSGHLVGKPRVVESTKHDILDEEAMRTVSSLPFPPLPASYDKPDAEFLVPIKFYLSD